MITVQAAFLAERGLANPDSTFMVWRGGITEVMTNAFPTPINLTMILRFEADREDAVELHEFGMRMLLDSQEIGPWRTIPIALRFPDDVEKMYLNFVSEVRFVVQTEGTVTIESMLDDRPIPTLRLKVKAAASPPSSIAE